MKVSFHQAVIGSCSGLKIFEDLRSQHWLRTLGHLLLLNFLCALLVVLVVYWQWRPQINGSIAEVADKCGELKLDKDGITPTKEPEKARSFIITGPLAVTYIPAADQQLPEDFQQGCRTGLIFSGKHIALWHSGDDKKFDVSFVNGSQVSNMLAESPDDMVKKMRQSQGITNEGTVVLNHKKMLDISKIMVAFAVISIAVLNIFEIAVYIAMFAGVFALMNIGNRKRVKIREMITLAVYAGFPPMIIGSVARALQLPFLDYNMIYVLGMTFYLMVIMNRLNRNAQEKAWQDEENKPL